MTICDSNEILLHIIYMEVHVFKQAGPLTPSFGASGPTPNKSTFKHKSGAYLTITPVNREAENIILFFTNVGLGNLLLISCKLVSKISGFKGLSKQKCFLSPLCLFLK